jgi:hypothetical protein
MSERIDKLKAIVERATDSGAFHVQSTPVREVFRGKVAWEGVVEAFSLTDHPTVPRCYAWSYQDDNGKTQFVTVLEKPPVTSPQTAVKVYLASLANGKDTSP